MKREKQFKRVLSLVLSLLMIITAMPMAFAATQYDETGATRFVFSSDAITVEKGDYKGYKIEGTALSIKDAGTYILSGECANGSIVVKKGVTGVVLILDGLTLASADTAPLTCNKSSEAKIVAKSGTVNTFTDTEKNNDDNYPDNENAENAVFKFKDGSNVELCGSGTINIVSKGKNGIKAGESTEAEGTASLTIKDVTLNIDVSVNDGINAESTLNIESGYITVSANDDGIHSDYALNIGKEGTDGPVIRVNKSYEALEGANITVYSGDIELHSSDDGVNAANSDLKDYDFSMTFAGGKTVVYADGGDGVDSNGSLTVSGGTLIVWTSNKADNQPLDADGKISITGGTVLAAGSSGGMGTRISDSQTYIQFGSNRMNPLSFIGGGFGRPSKPDASAPSKPSDGARTSDSRTLSLGSSNLGISAGETLSIKDASGNTLISETAPYEINSVIFSSPELDAKGSYTLYAGDNSVATTGCSCLCHKTGVLAIVWKVVLVVCKVFNINKTCSCGAEHY